MSPATSPAANNKPSPTPAAPQATPTQDAPIEQAVNQIFEQAHNSRATDVHIEPHDTLVQIRFRIDGTLRDTMTLPHQIAPAVMSRIKLMSQLNVNEYLVPQNGRLKVTHGAEVLEARVSVLPVVGGEKIVMHILDDATKIRSLADLGLNAPALTLLEKKLKLEQGMVLVTGPTGSGKTTTLYSALTSIDRKDDNISTVEDPVEYSIPGTNQTQVDARTGMTFATCLRAILRQDPNVIMIGELRDNETANLAMQATMSGHAVYAGLYTESAAAALPRLLNMGLEPFLVATSVKAVVAQRLVRKLCPHCREKYTVSADELERMNAAFPIHRALEAYHVLQNTGSLPATLPSLTDTTKKDASSEQRKSALTQAAESRKVIPVPDDLTTDRANILHRIASDPSLINRPYTGEESNEIRPTASDHKVGYSPADISLFRAKGCDQCSQTGYFGRLGIFEVLDMTPEIIRLVTESAATEEISTQATNAGMMTMQEDGYIKALQGLTTIDEVLPLAS